MIVTYNGLNYCGYQKQPKGRTIQTELETAIKILTKEQVKSLTAQLLRLVHRLSVTHSRHS